MELRPATEADVPAVLDLWSTAAENDARPADTATHVRRLLERDPEALVLAWDGEHLVGSVIAGWDGWRAHLYRLAVAPHARRRGVAAALMDHAEARLVGLGATRLDAMVLDGNDLGQALWLARGYVRQAEWGRWVKPVG